ncbi:hypothetical protein [Caproiciproducens faecalis]|uniref:Uncharacterized protein n=1 Tax=Caproiciproducens faecalis TaxID=2820301 RepID=A0ABS7DQL3_9FIRM|nr:hypothetical protein [Caproiciproducens faecalis]MBW7573110.1 hypothetical protein [Caproiciproducens faecalis]
MNIKSKRFVTVFLTLIFAVTVFTLTAFAEGNPSAQVDPPTQEISSTVSPGDGTATQPGDGTTTQPGDGTATQPDDGTTTQPGDGTTTQPGDGTTTQPDDGTVSSKPETSSSESPTTTSSSKAPVVNHYVDTHTNQVEQRASQAAQTISDPDVLSSQDWGELLSSGESASSGEAVQAGGTVSSEPESPSGIGGVSWLLILGVVLIVLALCGIGLFIYLQFFFQERQKNLKFAPAGNAKKQEEPAAFEDISSYSEEAQHPSEPVSDETRTFTDIQSRSSEPVKAPAAAKTPQAAKNRPAAKPHPDKKPVKSDLDETAPIPQDLSSRSKPSAPSADRSASPKSQAQPVKDSDFDWEKFFNEEK